MPFDKQSMPSLNSLFSSCSPPILLLISTVDPFILYFQNDISFRSAGSKLLLFLILFSQVFPGTFPLVTSGEPHHSGFKFLIVALPL
jgi:hypothetical protein